MELIYFRGGIYKYAQNSPLFFPLTRPFCPLQACCIEPFVEQIPNCVIFICITLHPLLTTYPYFLVKLAKERQCFIIYFHAVLCAIVACCRQIICVAACYTKVVSVLSFLPFLCLLLSSYYCYVSPQIYIYVHIWLVKISQFTNKNKTGFKCVV